MINICATKMSNVKSLCNDTEIKESDSCSCLYNCASYITEMEGNQMNMDDTLQEVKVVNL